MSDDKKPDLTLVEDIEFDDEDQADVDKLLAQEPTYHTLLQVWSEVIKPAAEEAKKKVQPQWAARITAAYPAIQIQEMVIYRDLYFGKVDQLRQILDDQIKVHTTAEIKPLSYTTPEDDVENNTNIYKNLLLLWQQQILQWEMDWECTHKHSHIDLAAISEVHKMFFSQTGLINFLDQIGFVFTEEDQAELQEALREFRGEDE